MISVYGSERKVGRISGKNTRNRCFENTRIAVVVVCCSMVRKRTIIRINLMNFLCEAAKLCKVCFKFKSESCEECCLYNPELNFLSPGKNAVLENLGYMELQSLRLIQPFCSIRFYSKSLPSVLGQFLYIVSDIPESQIHLLPRPADNCFLSVCQAKPNERSTARYSVDYKVVRQS